MVKQIILVKPRGLCAGVDRALRILELAVKKSRGEIYCRHQIVHNKKVVEEFSKKGVIFVEKIKEIPDGSTVVFSAHGSSPALFNEARDKNLKVIDSVCPLVTKVHEEAKRFADQGYFILYIGHKGHPEPAGVLGEVSKGVCKLISSLKEAKAFKLAPGFQKVAVLTQTTLSLDETKATIEYLKKKFNNLELPLGKDICFSTQNRQVAVKKLAEKTDLILVVGSKESSNSNRLREVGEKAGTEAYLIDGPENIKKEWFEDKERVGVTAGASVPDKLVDKVIKAVQKKFGGKIEEMEVIPETAKFPI